MNFSSKVIQKAVEEFARFPGVGKKTAMRLIFHLIKQQPADLEQLEASVRAIRNDLKFCDECGNVSDSEICGICADKNRNHKLICVVEDMRDVMAIENTEQFRGVYHILGGLISPIDGIGPEDLSIDKLQERVRKNEVEEVIIALSANMEGDTTGFYLSRKMKNEGLKVSTLSRGISIGGELEYADEITLGRSISSRVPFE